MLGIFAAAYHRNVASLTPLIGLEASVKTVRANNWVAVGWVFGILLFVPLATWAQLVQRSTNSLTIRRSARMMSAWPIVPLPLSFSTMTAGRP